jgi:glycosyltransferase involved in cell wall biosynthesis
MRIALDHQAFCLQQTGGISRYFVRLAQELLAANQHVGVFAPLYRNQYLRELPQDCVRGRAVANYPPRCADVSVFINGMIGRRQLRSWHPEIVHETYFTKIKSGTVNCPTVLTVFDMISELGIGQSTLVESELKYSPKYMAVKRADHIICISENTRQDLIRLFNIRSTKISTIHLGCDSAPVSKEMMPKNVAETAATGEKPFLLYVGLREGYKNFLGLLHAVASSTQLKSSFDIIAFGADKFNLRELELIRHLNFSDKQVRQISGDDTILQQLYLSASALVYPSLYEGFGLPPLEAMAHRCPVISSNTSSMPEIIGEAAEFFDPNKAESIAMAIENVVYSAARTQDLISKGLQRVQAFTWKASARQHLALYQTLC